MQVIAPAGGRVVAAGWAGGYGNRVCVNHAPRLTTCSAHLSAVLASVGQSVAAGEDMGLVGCSGRCFGDHVHFEVRLGPSHGGPAADPLRWLVRMGGDS